MRPDTVAVILAGGRSRRMGGGDKALLDLGGRPMAAHIVERLRPQVSDLVLSANGDARRFAPLGLPVVADPIVGPVGPLAGVLAGLRWAREREGIHRIVTLPSDTPFLPGHLVERLLVGLQDGDEGGTARSRGRAHPTVSLWPVTIADELARWLADLKHRAMHEWMASRTWREVDIEGDEGIDPFFNVNMPADLERAGNFVRGRG